MNKKIGLSIVIPVLNESNNIDILTNKIIQNLKKINFELIFVDDNSIDKSKKILNFLKKKYKFFKPIFRKKKEISLNHVLKELKKVNLIRF